jgi:hypothetical protein
MDKNGKNGGARKAPTKDKEAPVERGCLLFAGASRRTAWSEPMGVAVRLKFAPHWRGIVIVLAAMTGYACCE